MFDKYISQFEKAKELPVPGGNPAYNGAIHGTVNLLTEPFGNEEAIKFLNSITPSGDLIKSSLQAEVVVHNFHRHVDTCIALLKVYQDKVQHFSSNVPGQALPLEIDRVPEMIRERVPECDPVIVAFIEEAIRCIRADAFLGAAFMLGAASEKALNLLICTYADYIPDATEKEKFLTRVNNRMISGKWEEFTRSFKSCRSKPTDGVLADDLETVIGTMFHFCRITRNGVGHPQIVPDLDRGVLLANLGHFVTYIERIYGLMSHFRENGLEV